MPGHERFQEICATASIGQASGTELADLREHLASCLECRQRFGGFMELQASHYALNAESEELGADEAMESIDSALFRERFLRRAESEGIVFSAAEPVAPLATARIGLAKVWDWPVLATRIAAGAALASALILTGFYLGIRRHVNVPAAVQSARDPILGTDTHRGQDVTATITELEARNRDLTRNLGSLRAAFASNLSQLQSASATTEKQQSALVAGLKERDTAIAELQGRLGEAQASVVSIRAELERAQTGASENQASLVESQIRVRELSEQLAQTSTAMEREKELFVAGSDVRELMAARNLHIVDVFDTDPKGKTRPSFGRLFFTEGKSLIFYAYDLNDAKVQSAGYHYRVWGKREGVGQRARSLGMFYSDDKSQKRWVFQSDDPQILNEIDSVFVTLEPPNGNPAQPKGDKLMYAYLRGQANHP